MRWLLVVMLHVGRKHLLEVTSAQHHDSMEALCSDRSDPSLGIGVRLRGSPGISDDFDTFSLEDLVDVRAEAFIPIGGVTEGPANLAWCAQIARNLSEAREDRPGTDPLPRPRPRTGRLGASKLSASWHHVRRSPKPLRRPLESAAGRGQFDNRPAPGVTRVIRFLDSPL